MISAIMTAGSITTYRPSSGDAKSFWYGNISSSPDALATITSNRVFVMIGERACAVDDTMFQMDWKPRDAQQQQIRDFAAEEFSRVALALEGDSFA